MNCHDVEGLLGAYADGELDVVRSLDTEAHLRECPDCATALDRLEAVRSAVARAPYYSAPPDLRRKLARRVEPRWEWRGQWAAMAAAACLALAAVGVWRFAPAPGVEREVVAAHVRSLQAEHLMDVPSSDRHTVKPWFAGKLDFAPEVPDLSAQGFTLVGGRLDYLGGRAVAAIVYRRRQHVINVFTWPSARRDESPRSDTIQGYHVVYWVRNGMAWWAVSDLAPNELAELPRLL